MSFSAELQECIDLFIKEGFPRSKSKQKALLEAVLLHMGVTEMDELSDVDHECVVTVGDELQLSPIARNTMRRFFNSFGSTLTPSDSSSVGGILPLGLDSGEVPNGTEISFNASQEVLGDHNQGYTSCSSLASGQSLRSPSLRDYSWGAYDKMHKEITENMSRTVREAKS